MHVYHRTEQRDGSNIQQLMGADQKLLVHQTSRDLAAAVHPENRTNTSWAVITHTLG